MGLRVPVNLQFVSSSDCIGTFIRFLWTVKCMDHKGEANLTLLCMWARMQWGEQDELSGEALARTSYLYESGVGVDCMEKLI